MTDTITKTACPKCTKVGGLHINIQLVSKPLGTFSLAGAQVKTSAYQAPVLECQHCDLHVAGRFDGDNHASFNPA